MKRAAIAISLLVSVAGCEARSDEASPRSAEASAPSTCVERFMANFKVAPEGPVSARYTFDVSEVDEAWLTSVLQKGLDGQRPSYVVTTRPLAEVEPEAIDGKAGGGVLMRAKDGALFVFEDPELFSASDLRAHLAEKCAMLGPDATLRSVTLTSARTGATES